MFKAFGKILTVFDGQGDENRFIFTGLQYMIQLFTIHGNALCSAPDSTKSTQQVLLAGAATDQAID